VPVVPVPLPGAPVTVPVPFPLGIAPLPDVPLAALSVPVAAWPLLLVVPAPLPALPLIPVPLPVLPVTVPLAFPAGTDPLPGAEVSLVRPKVESVIVVPPVLSVPVLMLPVLSLTVLVVVSFAPFPQDANASAIAQPKITFFISLVLIG